MLHVTAFTTVVMTLVLTGLSIRVSQLRLRHRVSLGHGGQKDLEVASRAHGNTLEQSLLFLFLLLLCEVRGVGAAWMAGIATAFVMARLLHAVGMFGRRLLLRQMAHTTTLLLQLGLAVLLAAEGVTR
jgi:uncharacterized protein